MPTSRVEKLPTSYPVICSLSKLSSLFEDIQDFLSSEVIDKKHESFCLFSLQTNFNSAFWCLSYAFVNIIICFNKEQKEECVITVDGQRKGVKR